MRSLAALLLCLVVTSCATNPRPWTRGEKLAAAAAIACIGADVGTTAAGRTVYGLRELNPLAERYWSFALVKLGTAAISYVLGEYTDARLQTWTTVAVLNCGIAGWNGAAMARAD